MTTRLPIPGADTGDWGDLLNAYLSVDHNATGQNVFTPPRTGAVQRAVDDRLSETISLEDFGAVGDGVTDDSAALIAANTALATTGGVIRANSDLSRPGIPI